jgi:hypothetical protein
VSSLREYRIFRIVAANPVAAASGGVSHARRRWLGRELIDGTRIAVANPVRVAGAASSHDAGAWRARARGKSSMQAVDRHA